MSTETKVREILPGIVKSIRAQYDPLKIILFGSYATGRPDEDSDVDILVVMEGHPDLEESYRLRQQLLREFSVPVQTIFISRQEFEETKNVIGGITYPAAKYGKALYEKS